MSEDPAVPTLLPAVLFVEAWYELLWLAGPENPRNESGGGMWPPVLLRLRPCRTTWFARSCTRSCVLSWKRGMKGGSAASRDKSRWCVGRSCLKELKDSSSSLVLGRGSWRCVKAGFLPFVNRIESRIPGFFTLACGISKSGGAGAAPIFGGAAEEGMISGTSCWEWARKERDVSQR